MLVRSFGLLAFVVVLCSPPPAAASPPDLFGFGGRSPALGMTGVSYSEGYEASYLNPAGLARSRNRSLSIGLHAHAYRLTVDDERFPINPSTGMSIGFALPIPFGGPLEDRLVLGGAFFTPTGNLLEGAVFYPERSQFPVLDRAQVAAVSIGLGVDLRGLLDGLRLGVGVAVIADLVGDLTVFIDETVAFSSQVETQLLASYAPVVGVSWDHRDLFGVGLVYRSELAAQMSLNIESRDLPVVVPTLRVGGLVQYDPHQISFEGFYRIIPELMVTAQLSARLWSGYEGPQQRTTDSSTLAPDPEFSNVFVPRFGVEGRFHSDRDRLTLLLRGGYAFEPSPAPPARIAERRPVNPAEVTEPVPLRYLDNDRHVLTAGAGVEVGFGDDERVQLDVYGQLHLLASRTHDIPDEGGSQNLESSGAIWGGGFTATVEF
ncbi:MAG: hypothetical protein AAGF12_24510 [Myxococcota bacterium]